MKTSFIITLILVMLAGGALGYAFGAAGMFLACVLGFVAGKIYLTLTR